MLGLGFLLFIISVLSVLLTYRKLQLAAKIIIITVTIYWIISSIYFTYLYTFQGKIIDAETKEPLEGAVVLASFSEETNLILSTHYECTDVKEVLTDSNGEWKIKGSKGELFIPQLLAMIPHIYYTESPEFIVFKPGYCSYPGGYGINECKIKLKTYKTTSSNNIGEIVELPKLKDRSREKLMRNNPFILCKSLDTPIFDRMDKADRTFYWKR